MHPSRDGLIAFGDAEAGPASRRRFARHLSQCEKCRGELRRIQNEKDQLSVDASARVTVDLRPGLARLLSSMASWREGRTGVLGSEVKRRIRLHTEIYLGSPAISLVERPGMPPEELLANTGLVLDALLGPEAADAVRDDVLNGLECAAMEPSR